MRPVLSNLREQALLLVAVVIVVIAFVVLGAQVRDAMSTATACAAPGGPPTEARALLLELPGPADPGMDAWAQALSAEGLPYERVTVRVGAPSVQRLQDGPNGRFQFVVTAPGARSALDDSARRRLDGYERRFRVREILAFAPPLDRRGRPIAATPRTLLGTARVTPAGARFFTNLTGTLPLQSAPAYLAEPAAARRALALVRTPGGLPLVSAARTADGREQLAVSLYGASYLRQFALLSHGLIAWATRGVHLGIWRAYLGVQVDDLLLSNARWDPVANRTAPDLLITMYAADVEAAARWSRRERFRLDLAFNGRGAVRSADGELCDPLFAAVLARRDDFGLINHTYDHLDLDKLPTRAIEQQIDRGVEFARARGLAIQPRELVTGEHSGLRNPAMPQALREAGIRFIASDASREPRQRRLGPALTVPRNAPNIFYDAGTRREQVDEYNHRYLDTCRSFCLPKAVDWPAYVRAVGADLAGFAFRNDPRPSFVHQSNLAEDRILLSVLTHALTRIRGALAAPLMQPTLTQAGELMRRQDAWRRALNRGDVAVLVRGGTLTLRARRTVLAPVTGTTATGRYGPERSGWVLLTAGRTVTLR